MPLNLPNAQNPVDPRVISFLTRILGKQGGKGALDALASLSLAPTPMGAIKPELVTDQALNEIADLMRTGGRTTSVRKSAKLLQGLASSPESLAALADRLGRSPEGILNAIKQATTPEVAKAPELSAEATAGLSDEELDILGDLLGTGGGAPAAVGKKAADRFAKIASQVSTQPEGAKALESAKAQAASAGRPVETEVPKLLRPKGGSKAAKEAFESQSGGAIHDLLGRLRQSDKQVRDLQLQHARELSERLNLPLDQVLSMLRNPSRE